MTTDRIELQRRWRGRQPTPQPDWRAERLASERPLGRLRYFVLDKLALVAAAAWVALWWVVDALAPGVPE